MKKIRIITLMTVLLFGSTTLFAQGFGLKGSFNFFNLTQENASGKKVENKMFPTFNAGLFYEIPVASEFYLRPELLFSRKGAKNNELVDLTAHLSYVEVPVLFLYKGGLGNNHVLLGFGPYVGWGVGGKFFTDKDNKIDVKFKNDVTDADEIAAYFKPLDFGANLMAGYEFGGGLSFALNASLGLANIESKYDGKQPDSSTKNTGFGLSLGYRF